MCAVHMVFHGVGGDVAWVEVVITSGGAVRFRQLIILALVVDMAEAVSSDCNTSASISSSPLVASSIFTSNAVNAVIRSFCGCSCKSLRAATSSLLRVSVLDNSSSADCSSFFKFVRYPCLEHCVCLSSAMVCLFLDHSTVLARTWSQHQKCSQLIGEVTKLYSMMVEMRLIRAFLMHVLFPQSQTLTYM